MRLLACLALTGLLASLAPVAAGKTEPQQALDASVEAGLPGISAAIATRRGVIWSGQARSAGLDPALNARTRFGIGSITKVFVAVVIVQLAAEKRLDLNARVTDVLDAKALSGLANCDTFTVAQLMSHTGGVPSWEDDPAWIRDGRGDRVDPSRHWGKTDTLDYLRGKDHPPLSPPGAEFHYANTNYTLLGLIIERVTGHTAEREIRRRILTPLHMRDTYLEGFEPPPPGSNARRYHWATPTFRKTAGVSARFPDAGAGRIAVDASNLSVEWTAGAMVSSAGDLARFALALRDGRLVDPAGLRFMQSWTPIVKGSPDSAVGHGLFRVVIPGVGATIGHDGDVLGSTAAFWWQETGDAVVVVMSNIGTMHAGDGLPSAISVAHGRFAAVASAYAKAHGARR